MHYLPHFNTLPEPPASTPDDLLLRRQAQCLHGGQAGVGIQDGSRLQDGASWAGPGGAGGGANGAGAHAPPPLLPQALCFAASRTRRACRRYPCRSRDALTPEALNIASYDTRQHARMAQGGSLKTGLGQAIRDIK